MDAELTKQYKREWYERNKEYVIRKKNERKKEIQGWLKTFKVECSECGESHPATLDFHHKDSSTKMITLGGGRNSVISQGWSKDRILDEMGKCVILCSNCHRKLHFTSL